jgi:hypothetical protein
MAKPRVGIIAAWIGGGCVVLAAIIGVIARECQSDSPKQFVNTGNSVGSHNNVKMANSPGAVQVMGNLNCYSAPQEETSSRNKNVPLASQGEVVNRSEFFHQRYGVLAVIPKAKNRSAAINANSLLVLSPCNQYQFKALSSPIWLQFNHYLPDTNSKRRHLGVFIVTFGRTGATMSLEVFRNKKWVRPGSDKVLNEFSEVVDLPWSEYIESINKWSSPEGKLSDSDRAVKGPWHAIPQGGKEFSWDYRKFWKWAASCCQQTSKYAIGQNPDFNNVKVSTRLISYSPTSFPGSKSPVIFDVRTMDEANTAVFIAIYALEDNGEDVREWYWIKRIE